jgi:hypothetical protein
MRGLLCQGKEVANTLADLYRIRSPHWSVDVTKVCGGCPNDRFWGLEKSGYHVPIAAPIQDVLNADLVRWKSTFSWLDPKYVIIFYDDETSQHSILKFLQWLVRECGIQELCADTRSALTQLSEWKNLYHHVPPGGVVVHRDMMQLDEEPYSPLARMTFFDNLATVQNIEQVFLLQRPFHVVILPASTTDPNNTQRRLIDTATNSARLEQLLAVIIQ